MWKLADQLAAAAQAAATASGIPPDAVLVAVPQWEGMTREEALAFRFGADALPAGVTILMLQGIEAPPGVAAAWWRLDKASPAFAAASATCSATVRALAAVGK